MRLVRTIFTLVVAASLAVLPARVGAVGMIGGAGTVASLVSDCPSIGDTSCQPAQRMSVDAGDKAPISDGCDRSGDHGTMLPGACSTYCNSLPTLPTIIAIPADVVIIVAVAPAVGTMDGIGVSPEPHPPKLI